jgi:hypothetical protein
VCAALAALALGCGDDDGPKSPEEKCEALASKYCGRQTQCAKESRAWRNQCEGAFILEAKCNSAISVTANYGACIDDLDDVPCNLIMQDGYIPASCSNVVIYAQ